MTGFEIKQKIDENNQVIEAIVSPNFFTLNNTVSKLLQENRELQKQCHHHFIDGYCEYCYMEEDRYE